MTAQTQQVKEKEEPKVTIVIVGFNVKQENSVLYEKLHDPTPTSLGNVLFKALALKDCDFVSVRRIRKANP